VKAALGLTLCAGISGARAASILYATDFNSATAGHTGNYSGSANYTDTAIIGQDGWAITGTSTVNPINVANTTTNGNVTMNTTGQDVQRQFATASPVTSGQVFLSADIDVTAANATGDYFIHLDDGTSTDFFDRVFVKSSGAGFVMAVGTSSGTPATGAYGTTVLNLNTTYHMVAEYDIVSGAANDTAALYINPTDPIYGGTNLYVAGVTQGVDAASIQGVNLRQGSTGPNVIVDNIAVAQAPEPASLSLIGLASLGLIRRRKMA
jgi:hypothetical protein